jgi:hypothetical protein
VYIIPQNGRQQRQEFIESLEKLVPNIEILEGWPLSLEEVHLTYTNTNKLLVIDDLIDSLLQSKSFLSLMLKDSHHSRISVVVSSQHVFFPARLSGKQ